MWKYCLLLFLSLLVTLPSALAKPGQLTKIPETLLPIHNAAKNQVRNLVEPVLQKYCRDECKLLNVDVTVDTVTPEEISPGFDEIESRMPQPAASSATVKVLINEKVGQVSTAKLMDLLQQYLDTLDFPVKVDLQRVHFPEPIEAASRVAELRERVAKQFKTTLEDLFNRSCPVQCLLADFELQTETVNPEEAQYGSPGEFANDGGVALRIKNIAATLLVDETLNPQERQSILEMARLKTNFFKNVALTEKVLKFPRPSGGYDFAAGQVDPVTGRVANRTLASEKSTSESQSNSTQIMNKTAEERSASNSTTANTVNSNSNSNDTSTKHERLERIERIERVENGDAVQAELQKFKVFGLIFACSILSLLIFLAAGSFRGASKMSPVPAIQRIIQSVAADPVSTEAPSTTKPFDVASKDDRGATVAMRIEVENITKELMTIFVQQPKVAKQVFTRILTEEGVEITAQYLSIFGESIVIDMMRDASLQSDLSELMEYYAKTPVEIADDEKLELLRSLQHRTVAGKLMVLGNRSSNLFDFLAEMDSRQIDELIRTESLTVKAIILTQCDPQKRASIYAHIDEDVRMKLLGELSRIDHLPRDYIFNVSNALKRKRIENPRLNTGALPRSEVLVSLLERTGTDMQQIVVKNLEVSNPESARLIKSKLVSVDTLRYLRDNQLLEVILSLRHDELLQFLKGAQDTIRHTIFTKSPKELIAELEEELGSVGTISREVYAAVERKLLNRMKLMANEGLINLVETNERMFSDARGSNPGFVTASAELVGKVNKSPDGQTITNLKKVAGW